ncbi:MAG: ABC transporter permease, partial [Candidatus Nanopelagicales bacterium]
MIKQSLRSLAGNPVRSVLTVLGVVIGIAAVIAVVALGKGLQQSVSSSITSLNPERITLTSQDPARQTAERAPGMGGPPDGGGGAGQRGGFSFNDTQASITAADVTALSSVEGVVAVSPEATTQLDVATTAGASTATAYQVTGVASSYAQMKDLTVATGAWLTPEQVTGTASAVVLGSDAAAELFGSGPAVGQTIYISDQPMTVVGVLAATATAQPAGGAGGPGGGPGAPGGPVGNADSKIFTGYLEWASITGAAAA